jgi:hypothetical protein
MLRTQISLDPKMYARLKAEARRQGVSIAEIMRRALVSSVGTESDRRPWMRHAGVVASGDPNASRSVDDVVYGRGRP